MVAIFLIDQNLSGSHRQHYRNLSILLFYQHYNTFISLSYSVQVIVILLSISKSSAHRHCNFYTAYCQFHLYEICSIQFLSRSRIWRVIVYVAPQEIQAIPAIDSDFNLHLTGQLHWPFLSHTWHRDPIFFTP